MMKASDWFTIWDSKYGFPDNYFVFDFETTGLSTKDDLILQIGFCHVENREVVANEGYILDWTADKSIDQSWLADRLATTKKYMEQDRATGKPNGKKYQFSMARLKEEGLEPRYVLSCFHDILRSMRAAKIMYAGYNIWHYDAKMFADQAKKFLNVDYTYGPNEIFDVGLLEKASQLNLLPWPGDSLETFSRRTYNAGASGRQTKPNWSLDRHTIPKYRLVDKHNLDISKAHHADFDSLATHYVLESQRELASLTKASR